MIVCIPSKGRPNTKTHLLYEGADVYHFVEPQDYHLYTVNNKVNIQENNKGIAFVRNFILNWSKKRGEEVVFMSDDDITGLSEYVGGNKKIDFNRLLCLADKFKLTPFEIGGFNYRQITWTEKKGYRINTQAVDQLVMLKPQKINWRYRSEFNLKEDRDFVLQCIKYGNGVLKFPKIGIASPEIGSNKGGLQNDYKLKKDEESVKKMVAEWHPFVSVKKSKRGTIDCKIEYKKLAESLNKKVV
jgi:glycosyltransferase involved in cell wall biosynthesis